MNENSTVPFTPSDDVNTTYTLRLSGSEGTQNFTVYVYDKFGYHAEQNGTIKAEFTCLDRSFEKQFHTGSSYSGLCDSTNPAYADFEAVRGNIRYCHIQLFARLEDDGSLTPIGRYGWPEWGVNFDQLVAYCDEIERKKGFYPVVGLWLFNFEAISEGGLRAFLWHWSYHLGPNRVIFKPCWEYNQLDDWCGYNPVFNRSWHIAPEDYNRVMGMIRRVRDELGIENILITSQANFYDK